MRTKAILLGAMLAGAASAALAQQVDISAGSVAETVAKLKPGQYAWAPQAAPEGPLLLIVNLKRQRAVLFRNGVPIAATTISTGKGGHETPTGVFSILEKQVEHYSSKYDSAPMPYMERLTWQGVALHAGHLPGYPASHGCIRLPAGFAKLLYSITRVGMTVVITDQAVQPRIAPAPEIVSKGNHSAAPAAAGEWNPGKSPTGPLSIVVSAADNRAEVLRNGVVIGSAPVTVDGPVTGSWAYALKSIDQDGQHWIRVALSSVAGPQQSVPTGEWQRFHAPDWFRSAVRSVLAPGTTVVMTPDSLASSAVASPVTVIEGGAKGT